MVILTTAMLLACVALLEPGITATQAQELPNEWSDQSMRGQKFMMQAFFLGCVICCGIVTVAVAAQHGPDRYRFEDVG